jgi:hypothetical protein
VSAQVSVYLRDDQVVVVPQGGGGGYSFDVEPVLLVAPDEQAVGEAVRSALEASASSQGHDPAADAGPYRSPALAAVGARSYKAFYRGASHCYLYEQDGNLVVLAFKPTSDRKGFDLAEREPVVIRDRGQLGPVVLECLRGLPRMP